MGKSDEEIAAEMEEWLETPPRGDRQWDGHQGSIIYSVLRERGWQRSRADEGYSRLRYTAWRHETEPGRVHVTQATFLGAFTQVERLGG